MQDGMQRTRSEGREPEPQNNAQSLPRPKPLSAIFWPAMAVNPTKPRKAYQSDRPATPGTSDHPETVAGILSDYLRRIRFQFYPDQPRQFFQQQRLILKGITYPAAWLSKRGVIWTCDQYRQVLDEIILTIQRHGDTAKIQFFPRYFLWCVQQHMAHREDSYYDLGKSTRDKMQATAAHILSAMRVSDAPADDPVEALATIHATLDTVLRPKSAGRRKSRPSIPSSAVQQTLF